MPLGADSELLTERDLDDGLVPAIPEERQDAAAHIARRILMESTTRREPNLTRLRIPSEYDLNPRWEKREQNQCGRILRMHSSRLSAPRAHEVRERRISLGARNTIPPSRRM
jgi:hypothetical protein